MTVVVAVSDGTRVCMASDSQTTDNGHCITVANKVFKHGQVLVGADGKGSIIDLFRYCSPPEYKGMENIAAWAFRDLVPWMHAEMERRSILDEDKSKGWPFPGSVILAHAERALIVALDGQIVEPERRWCAIGSGRAIASGAIHHALNADDWKADEVAIAGVEAACAMDNGCGLPIKHYWT